MKNIKYLILLAVVLLLPFVAFAEGEEVTTTEEVDSRAVVYFFHGDGCPHCEEARTWFNSIQEEHGYKFKLVEYEVWNNTDNAALMQKVSDSRNDNATGVPYILCGDKSWIGFSEDTMASEILAQIDTVFNTPVEERQDPVAGVAGDVEEEEEKSNDVVALIIILVVVGAAGFGIYKARETSNK